MLGNASKYFNNGSVPCTNRQLIGFKDLFRVVIVKECAASNQKRVDLKLHDKAIVKFCVDCFHECWKRRYVVVHEPEVQRKVLHDEVLAILDE